jgi:hypothetical protein
MQSQLRVHRIRLLNATDPLKPRRHLKKLIDILTVPRSVPLLLVYVRHYSN